MSRPPEWDHVDPTITESIRKQYPYIVQNVNQAQFPRAFRDRHIVEMLGAKLDYSCSLENARLALYLQELDGPSDQKIAQAIHLSREGADQWPLYEGLRSLGVKCTAWENKNTTDLVNQLLAPDNRAVYIWSGQQPAYSQRNHLLETMAGHYMTACHTDGVYVYFADPGEEKGVTRILTKYLDLLWHDVELSTNRIIYGFMIEVPITRPRILRP